MALLTKPKAIPQLGDVRTLKQYIGEKGVMGVMGERARYNQENEANINLIGYLERLSPTSEEGQRQGHNVVTRLLREYGIATRSNPLTGQLASPGKIFDEIPDGQGRFLRTLWAMNAINRVKFRPRQQQRDYAVANYAPGSWARPYYDEPMAQWAEEFEPQIPLNEIVRMTRMIPGRDYRANYLVRNVDELGQHRIAEYAQIPVSKLVAADAFIQLLKHGGGIQWSYEVERMGLDYIEMHLIGMALENEINLVSDGIGVLIAGDTNANTAAEVIPLTTLDPAATPPTMTLKALLNLQKEFKNPYQLTHILTRKSVATELQLLNTGSANIPRLTIQDEAGFSRLRTINRLGDTTGIGWTDDVPVNQLLAFDRRFAMDHLVEMDSDIQEMQQNMETQTKAIYFTQNDNFTILVRDGGAAKIVDLSS
jgi:hypothetical protein